MNFDLWPQVVLNSMATAAVLMPVALAWVTIFKTTGVLNMAVGQYAVVGAFIFLSCLNTGLPWFAAFVMAVAAAGLLGVLTYEGALRRLDGREHWVPVIVTIGLSFVLDSFIHLIWGSETRSIPPPTGSRVFELGHVLRISSTQLWAVALGVAAFAVAFVFFRLSTLGTRMRAAAEIPVLAGQSGISIRRMFGLGWAISCGLAAAGGVLFCMTTVLDPTSIYVGILALTPVLLGGLDSIGGVFLGSILIALVTNFAVLYVGSTSIEAVAGLVVVSVLMIRPSGLFGSKAVVRV